MQFHPDFLVIECSSISGAYSYILTSCTDGDIVDDVCEQASEAILESEGMSISFRCQTLASFIKNVNLDEETDDEDEPASEAPADDANGIDPKISNLYSPENATRLQTILEKLFDTGYDNGIISDYISSQDVPVLMVS